MKLLPQSWSEVEFGGLNEFSSRTIDPSQFPDEVFELYSVPIFPTGQPELVKGSEIGSTKQLVAPNDVLVCKINPRINRVWIVGRSVGRRQIASSEWIVLRTSGHDQRYLMHYFRSAEFRELLCADVTGVGGSLTRAQPKRVASFSIPIAPPSEQKRIADKLDALLARVDATRARLDRIPTLLKRFRQSVLAAATSGQLTEDWRSERELWPVKVEEVLSKHKAQWPKESGKYKAPEVVGEELWSLPERWAWVSASALVKPGAEIVYGIVQPGPKLDVGVPYIRGMDIENGKILINQLMKTSPEIANKYARASLAGGDVLLGIIRATKVAVVPDLLEGANITQGTARLRPGQFVTSAYLALALEAPKIQKWLHTHYRGIDMPGLNLSDVRRVPLPIPSISEQQEIVRRVEALFAFSERFEDRYQAAGGRVDRLTSAVLAKAFRGELVSQAPDDEPASVIFEKIRMRSTKSKA